VEISLDNKNKIKSPYEDFYGEALPQKKIKKTCLYFIFIWFWMQATKEP